MFEMATSCGFLACSCMKLCLVCTVHYYWDNSCSAHSELIFYRKLCWKKPGYWIKKIGTWRMQCVPKRKNPCGCYQRPCFSGGFKTAGLRVFIPGRHDIMLSSTKQLTLHYINLYSSTFNHVPNYLRLRLVPHLCFGLRAYCQQRCWYVEH